MSERRPGGTPAASSDATVVVRRRDVAGGLLLPGTVLGHTYAIEALLSRGSGGAVYRAKHVELGTLHAVKVIAPSVTANPELIHRLAEEVRKLGRLRNDVVVGYEGLFRGDGNMRYLVMEYVDGEPLAKILKGRRLEPDEVLRLRDRLVRGLAAAHEGGIVHHALSPDNIVLPHGDVDRARLMAFAIEQTGSRGDITLIRTRSAADYAYVSPEQIGLFGGRIDSRSDIYSLGLVLAAAAIGFGKELNMGVTPTEAMAARQRVPDLSLLPAALRPVIAPMLEPRPDDRPSSMRDLMGDASAPRRGKSRRRAFGSAKIAAVAVGALLLASAAIAAVTLLRTVPGNHPANDLRASLTAATAGYKCAAITSDVAADGSVRVAGHVATAPDIERLRRTVTDIPGVGPVKFEVGVTAWPYCEISALLSAALAGSSSDIPTLTLSAKTFHAGELLTADARAPAFDGYVYVDYFSDAEVIHLLPNPQDRFNLKPSRNHFVVGCPLPAAIALRGPAGQRALTLIVSSKPLFPELRIGIERSRDYLDSLSQALHSLPSAKIAAAMVTFELHDEAGAATAETPCRTQ
jgi:serine/threonine protein kinase